MHFVPSSNTVEQPFATPNKTPLKKGRIPFPSLSDAEVVELQKKYGPNHLLEVKDDSPLTTLRVIKNIFKEVKSFLYEQVFSQPLILLLLTSAGASAVMGQIENALSIMIAIIIVGTVAYIQERRTTNCLDALAHLSPSMCRVYRRISSLNTYSSNENSFSSSTECEPTLRIVECSSLVPGDLVQLAGGGDIIPADIRWLGSSKDGDQEDELRHLRMDESILTGESRAISVKDGSLGWMGTSVLQGSGFGSVLQTGYSTKLGKIKAMVDGSGGAGASEGNNYASRSPLQEHLDWLGGRLATMSLVVIALLTIVAMTPIGGSLKWIDAITQAISLAVAAIPEGMPVVATITLALCQYRLGKYNSITVKSSSAVEGMGSIGVVCMDKTGTLTLNKLMVSKVLIVDSVLFELSLTHCNSALIDQNGTLRGNSVDVALLEYFGAGNGEIFPTTVIEPFTSLKKMMSVRVELSPYEFITVTKGAPEVVMENCQSTEEVSVFCRERASHGERVIAVASTNNTTNIKSLIGLVSFEDPIREGAKEAVRGFLDAGITPVIVTGDHLDTALAIAKRISFPLLGPLVSGQDLKSHLFGDFDHTKNNLKTNIKIPSIVYRSRPEDKLDLIRWIKQTQKGTVAMTGDGVNDGPALKASDVSIGIGGGAEVAKAASNMILKESGSLYSIVDAILEGRHLGECMGNFVRFQLTISIASLLLVFLQQVLSSYLPRGSPTPLNSLQILLINIVMDGPPAQALGLEPLDSKGRDALSKAGPLSPERQRSDLLGGGIMLRIVGMSIHIALMCMWELVGGGGGNDGVSNAKDAQTRTFTLFVLSSFVCSFCCRQRRRRLGLRSLITGNKTLFVTICCSLTSLLMFLWIPALCAIIQSVPISGGAVLVLLCKSFTLLVHEELVKCFILYRNGGYTEL